MPPPIPVATPVATVVDTASDSWKRTFWTTLLPIVNFVVMVAIWKDLKGQLVHEKAKSCDSKVEAALAEVRDNCNCLQPNVDDSASAATAAADSPRKEEIGNRLRTWAALLFSPGDEGELHNENGSLKDQSQKADVPLPPASTNDFDDVSTTDVDYIPNGYRGLEWENVYVMHRSFPYNGLEHGIVSGNYVACNDIDIQPATITSATPFSVAGFHATAASRKDLNVLVEGFGNHGNRIGSYQTTLGDPRGGPTFIDLRREGNFEGLHKLKVTSSGGTDAGLGVDYGTVVVIDDLMVY